MGYTPSTRDTLKSWFLSGDKGKHEGDVVLSDAVFQQAIDNLEARLAQHKGVEFLTLDQLAEAVRAKDKTHLNALNSLRDYLMHVFITTKGVMRYEEPREENGTYQILVDSLRISQANPKPKANEKPTEIHATVDGALRKFSSTSSSLSFPGNFDSVGMKASDYYAFMVKLSASLAMRGSLPHLTLTNPDKAAMEGLREYFNKGGAIQIRNLHLDFNGLEVTDEYIDTLANSFKSMPLGDIGEISIESSSMNEERLARLVNKMIESGVAVSIKLPKEYERSALQKDLDKSTGNATRAARISQMSVERQKRELGQESVAPKRTRMRVKKDANIEVELQQQQQVEVQVQRARNDEESSKDSLKPITFEELKELIEKKALPLSLDKCLITDLELRKAWNGWFGHIATYRTKKDKKLVGAAGATPGSKLFNVFENNVFQHITEEACAMLLQYPETFQYGLDYHHLPAGFVILNHLGGNGKILHFNEMMSQLFTNDDLAIKLHKLQPGFSISDDCTKELLAAFDKHPCSPLITNYLNELEQAGEYDRQAMGVIRGLLPKLFQYSPADLKLLLQVSRTDEKIDVKKLSALLGYHDQEHRAKLKVSDPAYNLLDDILGDSKASFVKMKRSPYEQSTHPLTLILIKNHSAFSAEFQKWVKSKQCSMSELDSLYEVYAYYGVDGIKKIMDLSKNYGKSFDTLRLSLKHGNNYLQCINDPRSIRALTTICDEKSPTLTPNERVWLYALLQQHAASEKNINLADLVEAFSAFVKKVKEYNTNDCHLEFYVPVNFAGVKNMPVALGRMLTILKMADVNERETQWNCMTGLSLEADGAIHAVQDNISGENVCHIVIPEMETIAVTYAAPKGFQYNANQYSEDTGVGYQGTTGFQGIDRWTPCYIDADTHQMKRAYLEREFYRYVAYQEYRRPMDEYPDLLAIIKNKKFQPEIEMILYRILAETSTGLANSYENDKLSRDEYRKTFVKMIDQLDSCRLSIALTAFVQPLLQTARAAYALKGGNFMKDELRAPHGSYGLDDLIKLGVVDEAFGSIKNMPSIKSLYYLMYFTSSGIRDIGVARLVNQEDRQNAMSIMNDLQAMTRDERLVPFCNGMRFFSDKDVKSVDECRKYIDTCLAILYMSEKRMMGGYFHGSYSWARQQKDSNSISKNIIALISTFNMRDEIREYCENNFKSFIEENVCERVSFALSLLREIDIEIGRNKKIADLQPKDFYEFIESQLVSMQDPGYDNAAILKSVKDRFGAFYAEGYFDRFDVSKMSGEVKKKVSGLFAEEDDQNNCLNFLQAYQDVSDVEQYDKFFAILSNYAKRLTPVEMSSLMYQLSYIASIYAESGQAQPPFSEYARLLELVLGNNDFNNLVYCISSTRKEIDALVKDDPRRKTLSQDYLNKIFCFIEDLSPLYKAKSDNKAKSDSELSQAELMKFTSRFLNDSDVKEVSRNDFEHPSLAIYEKFSEKVLSDNAIEFWKENPGQFVAQLDLMIASMPELALVPEIIHARKHASAIQQENDKAAAAYAAQTLLQRVGNVAASAQAAGAAAMKSLGGWFQQLTGAAPVAAQPDINVQTVLSVDKSVLLAARTAVAAKANGLKTYQGMLESIVENMRMFVSRYPATREEIVAFYDLYCANVQKSGKSLDEAMANIISLRNLLVDVNDEKIVFALCLHFTTHNKFKSPDDLLSIVNSENFAKHTIENKALLLSVLVKLLNNGGISNPEEFHAQFHELVVKLLPPGNEQFLQSVNTIYKTAPYPSLNVVLDWMKDPDKISSQYNDYERLPYRRDGENNGFKLSDAITKSKLMIGIDLSMDELEALKKETDEVRELSIADLKAELDSLRMDFDRHKHIPRLVAITAELLYRSKGQEIHTTQYLAIYSMLKRGEHVTAEIGTGEGKTRIMMIMLVSQFVLGKTVDFITSDISLANRDFANYQSYFDLVGAESRLIHAASPARNYAIGGINFSDPSSIELFRNHAHSDGLSKHVIDPVPQLRACMLDEADKTYFDLADTRFNYSAASDEMLRDMEWIYPFLAAYVEERNPNDPTKYHYADLFYEDMDKCLAEFNLYIRKNNRSVDAPEQLARIKMLPQQQIEGWFDAAITARDLAFNDAFVIDKYVTIDTAYGPKVASEAKLLVGFRKDARSKFSFGVHQCLHARLNILRENIKLNRPVLIDRELKDVLTSCNQPFHIEDEKQIVYTSSSKTLLNDYDKGSLYAVTGTAGSISEREEARNLYALTDDDVEHAPVKMEFIDIPRHKDLKRVDKPFRLVANDKQEIKFLAKEILLARSKKQPTMIFCSSDAECQRIFEGVKEYLRKHDKDPGEMLKIDGMTDMETENEHIENDIGRPGVVTFTTPKLGRGVDVSIPEHKNKEDHNYGLKAIVTGTMLRHRDYYQVIARAGRFGIEGESRVIFNKQRVKAQLGKKTLTDGFYTAPQTYINREQAKIDRRKQVERLIKFAFVDFRANMQSALYQDFYYGLTSSGGRSDMRRLWQACSTELDQKWNTVYERIVQVLHKEQIDMPAIDALLSEMHAFASKQWGQLLDDLSHYDSISQADSINGCMRKLRDTAIPTFKLSKEVSNILTNYSIDHATKRTTPIYAKYDPAHDGQAAIYRNRFELLRATFAGERRLFADLRAWWKGRGILFANIRAWYNGDVSFKLLMLGGKGAPVDVDAKIPVGSSQAAIHKEFGNGAAEIKRDSPDQAAPAKGATVNLSPVKGRAQFFPKKPDAPASVGVDEPNQPNKPE